jgi:hypothetical protein
MNSTPFSRALYSMQRESAAPFVRMSGPATADPSPIRAGANWLELTPSMPASSGVIVPARMSVTSPSLRIVTARRAREIPPVPCVPEIRAKRT